jgi:hypothetical protein
MASTSEDWESFHARACSLPPDPTTRIFIISEVEIESVEKRRWMVKRRKKVHFGGVVGLLLG